MQLIVEISMDNSAFDEPLLLPAILETLASRMKQRYGLRPGEEGALMDSNGNRCGSWKVTDD